MSTGVTTRLNFSGYVFTSQSTAKTETFFPDRTDGPNQFYLGASQRPILQACGGGGGETKQEKNNSGEYFSENTAGRLSASCNKKPINTEAEAWKTATCLN